MVLYALDLSEADIVLGVQWMKKLGPVVTDYTTLITCFSHASQQVNLQANVLIHPINASAQQLRRLAHTHDIFAMFPSSLLLELTQPTSSSSLALFHLSSLELNDLLSCFDHLF